MGNIDFLSILLIFIMKYAIAILIGAIEARHHHHHHTNLAQMRAEPPAEAAGDEGAATEAEQKAEAKEEVKEKLPTAADTIKAAQEVLKNKPLEPIEAEMAAARKADAEEAKSVAKHDAIGKGIIADMYASRAAAKVAAVEAEDKMVEVLKERQEVNAAQEKARQAAA